ncbi:hypothetical protein CIHG_06714 [Coccidioides immitis H538.4]|uniref:K Homology domain-containing protein n=1 Tax=Coccidioides immitis H538.4 TaxID=396776 RepID=A0A0J8RVS2_COCIT|nr:hypothetical protein CIHG_06714 [Coccidioides immitis H538.4]
MADQQNISQILAALAAAQPGGLAAPATFAGSNPSSAPLVNQTGFSLPPPDSTGSVDISGVKPVNTGSVSIADAIAKARGIAAEKGIAYGSNHGLIIGRGGETIKDLQDRSGCHVIIAPEDKSLNGLRPVNLNGAPRAIQRAKDLILEVVETDSRQGGAPPQREPRGYAPERDTGAPAPERGDDSIFIPKESVGMIIGKVNILPAVGREVDREVVMIGSKQAIEQMKKSILEKVDTFKSRSQARRDDGYSERYSQPQLRSYPQDQAKSSQPSQASAPAAGGDSADPYAMYGGYENYVAMWYAAMAQQQQQQQQPYQQQSPSDPKPPGVP